MSAGTKSLPGMADKIEETVGSTGYRATEMGQLPNDWKIMSLGDVCVKVQDGNYGAFYPKSSEFIDYGIPFLTSKVLGKTGRIDVNKIDYISNEKHRQLAKAHLELNDVLFTNRGASVGAIGFVDESIAHGNIGPQLTLLRANNSTNPEFLYQIMKSFWVQNQIQGQDSGSAMNFFGIGTTLKFKFPLPNLKEQTAIANALSDVDALMQELEKLIAKKQAIKTATMQQLLTGRTRLPQFAHHPDGRKKGYKPSELGEIPEDWEVVELGGVAKLYQPETISSDVLKPSGYPVYGANGVIGFYDRFNHPESQVIVTCRGSTCGTVNKTVPESWITGNAMVVDVSEKKVLDKNFAFYLLSFQDLTVCVSGSGQPQIVRSPLSAFRVLVPHIDEQSKISETFEIMDAEICSLKQRLNKTRQIKQGMMQELLTGKTRLVKPESSV